MYDIQGALRRRALKERLEALARTGDGPSAEGLEPGGATGGDVGVLPPQGGAGQYVAGLDANGQPVGKHRDEHRDEPSDLRRRAEPTFPQTPAARRSAPAFPENLPGAGLAPSPYMTPVAPPALTDPPALAAPPASAAPPAPPFALRPELPGPRPAGLPAPGVTGATVAVTLVPGSPLSTRVPGRSGAARPGDLAPSARTAPVTATPPEPLPAAEDPTAAEPTAGDPTAAEPGPGGEVHPDDTPTPTLGTAASAIADLLRHGGTSLFFRRDAPED